VLFRSERVLVFLAALITHRELTHRGLRAIVWNSFDYRKPRTAIRAVDKRISVTAVTRVEQLSQAVPASADVGGNRDNPRTARIAFDYAKALIVRGRQVIRALDRVDNRTRRRAQFDVLHQG